MLNALLRAIPKDAASIPDPEDYCYSSLGLIFTDDIQNQHGDPDTVVHYRSNGYGDLVFQVADPQAETERTKFAHHLWNSGVLLGELVGGRGSEGKIKPADDAWGQRSYSSGKDWWLAQEDEKKWRVKGESVIELGAGQNANKTHFDSGGLNILHQVLGSQESSASLRERKRFVVTTS